MVKRQDYLEMMIALILIAFIIALLFGEAQRDVTYGKLDPQQIQEGHVGDIPVHLSQLLSVLSLHLRLESKA